MLISTADVRQPPITSREVVGGDELRIMAGGEGRNLHGKEHTAQHLSEDQYHNDMKRNGSSMCKNMRRYVGLVPNSVGYMSRVPPWTKPHTDAVSAAISVDSTQPMSLKKIPIREMLKDKTQKSTEIVRDFMRDEFNNYQEHMNHIYRSTGPFAERRDSDKSKKGKSQISIKMMN